MTFAPVPILDLPSKNPGLGFPQFAESIASLIVRARPPRMTVGVFGGYGTGKTTLMEAVRSKLEDHVIPVEFNAWRYDHEEHLFLPFLSVLHKEERIRKDPSLVKRLSAACRAFIRGLTLKFNTGIADIQLAAKDATKEEEQFLQDSVEKILGDYRDVHEALKGLFPNHNLRRGSCGVVFAVSADPG